MLIRIYDRKQINSFYIYLLSVILLLLSGCATLKNDSKYGTIQEIIPHDICDISRDLAKGNKPFVYFAFLKNVREITSLEEFEFTQQLPNTLIIKPGKYNFYNKTYDLKDEGLYRFIFPEKEHQQRIVYRENIDALLSSLAWIVSHGNSDNSKSLKHLTRKAMKDKLYTTCGAISYWAQYILNHYGIKARVVSSLTLDDWDTYSNGHTLIEVYIKKYNKWILYDLDQNAFFSQNGVPLSLIEFVKVASTGFYEINYIADDIRFDVSNYTTKGYCYNFIFEQISCDIKQWYKRVMQVPFIRSGKHYLFFDKENRSRIESYSTLYKYIEKDKFFELFYPNNF